MAKNNNQAGEDFQNFILESNDLISSLLSLTENDQLLDIDSKDKLNYFSQVRKQLTETFKSENDNFAYQQSALRGDILLNDVTGLKPKRIFDAKNYFGIQGTMKFIGEDVNKFMKGIDSNIKYILFHKLNLFQFIDGVLFYLKDYCKSEDNKDWFNNLKTNYSEKKSIGKISRNNFIDLFCFMELGFGWKEFGLNPVKSFISKTEDNYLLFSSIDFDQTLNSHDLDVKFFVNVDGYIYIYFYQGDDCVYILSQRDSLQANCSFINKEYMQVVNKVEIPT